MKRYPKHIRKHLRELARVSTEQELKRQLMELAEKFTVWKEQKISGRELRHLLHAYVDGPSRELFKRHRSMPDALIVADAVARGILTKEDIPEEVLPYIQNGGGENVRG